MHPRNRPTECTLGELLIHQIALSVEDGTLVFHGFGSPLVQLALHLAKRTHAPDMVLVAGATYGINPSPPFLTPTSNDWAMSRDAECFLGIEELFDLSANGRLDRMFLSGLQIDQWGNMNVTRLGSNPVPKLKLPGGGGGCNLSCDAGHVTIWTTAHRTRADARGQRLYRLVERCDFVTSVGHRAADGRPRSNVPCRGGGPDRIITDLGVFDFDESGHARLRALYPDTDAAIIAQHTEFDFPVAADLGSAPLPDAESVAFIRAMDPLMVHEKEIRPDDRGRRFPLAH